MKDPAFPPGHFYSPVVDPDEAGRDASRIWPLGEPSPMAHVMKKPALKPTVTGIDWNAASHEELLTRVFPELIDGFDYPLAGPADDVLERFYEGNSQFNHVDARVAFCMLRHLRPQRIIEVGSGYSTLLMADVNARFLDHAAKITCIEPYPRPFLQRMRDAGEIALLEQRAQDVPEALFETLRAGDLLFIDSSHVSKTGSDVNRLMLDLMPQLAPGVMIHVHDIFFPNDYPDDWVIEHGFSWNEQYLLQALLIGSEQFRVIFGCSLARQFHAPSLFHWLGRMQHGASLWLARQ